MTNEYINCSLCGRNCKVDRTCKERGFCRMGHLPVVARASLHAWEEPIISGERGSGTIFFSGCSLGCVYCQNRKISRGEKGKEITSERLAEIMLELENNGAHNINLVTPTHFVPSIREAIIMAKRGGLDKPIVYNTSSYDTVETLKSLDGLVDIYLPDLKYYRPKSARELSFAENYVDTARAAIAEMVRQQPAPVVEDGLMKRGVIVRILLLPRHVAEAKLSLKYLYETYGDSIYISLMNQYTPFKDMKAPLNRPVSREEYRELLEYAEGLGLKNGFSQEFGTASESFIPDFDNSEI